MLGRPERRKAELLGRHRHCPHRLRLDRRTDADRENPSDPHCSSPLRAARARKG
jgi:hypothetical protein